MTTPETATAALVKALRDGPREGEGDHAFVVRLGLAIDAIARHERDVPNELLRFVDSATPNLDAIDVDKLLPGISVSAPTVTDSTILDARKAHAAAIAESKAKVRAALGFATAAIGCAAAVATGGGASMLSIGEIAAMLRALGGAMSEL